MPGHRAPTLRLSPPRTVPSVRAGRVVMPPQPVRRTLRRRHLRFALLVVVTLLTSTLGYLAYAADLSGRAAYEMIIGALWACWLGLPTVATRYAEWRFGPARLVQPRLSRPQAPSTALVHFRGGEPSLN